MATDAVTLSPTINGDSVSLTAGMIVRLKPGANNNVVRAQADSPTHVLGVNGVVVSGASAPTGVVGVVCTGRETIQMESGLTLAAGDTVYVSPTVAGKGTNVLPANVSAIGTVADISNYARSETVEVAVNISAVTPASVSGVSGVSTQKPGDSVVPNVGAVVIQGGGQAVVADLAALAALDATNFSVDNSWAWVTKLGRWFQLQTAALTVDGINTLTASGLAGAQWVAMLWRNPVFEAQTTWNINTSTGNDEGAGTIGDPLKTVSELARRLAFAQLTATVTATVVGDMAGTDKAIFTFYVASGGSFNLVGTPTVLYTGTISGTTTAGAAPTTGDNTLSDTGITGGSFTAAGAMAQGVLFTRTSGTVCSWFAVKDKGSETVRISVPMSGIVTGQTLNNGDTYNFAQLPTLIMPRFPNAALGGGANTGGGVTIKNWLSTATFRPTEGCYLFQNCWITAGKFAGGCFLSNCCVTSNTQFTGSATNFEAGPSTGICGGTIGTAAFVCTLTVFACCYGQIILPVPLTIQSSSIQVSAAYLEQNGPDILAYDSPSYVFLIDYNAKFLQKHSGAFGGSGNAALCNAAHGSWFMHQVGTYWLAGSSTDAVTPILCNGSAGISVATEAAGGGVPNAQQNGVFGTS